MILILIGTLLLSMPFSTHNGIGIIDALFTSTSAVCVTGLIVKDTQSDFTIAGKIIILILIQFGGLGIMTFSIALLALMGGGLSIKWGFTFESMYSELNKLPVLNLLIRIVLYTISIELLTAIILFTQFYGHYSLIEAIGHSVFHAVSAFCNAGFSTFSDNLAGFGENYIIIITISIAVIIGGLGFIVLNEISFTPKTNIKKFFSNLSIHTKVVLATTSILVLSGMTGIIFLEWNYNLSEMNIGQKFLTSFFHSITCRTAGFNTIDIGTLRQSTLSLMTGLMLIGGSPGSIAGGIKTTTITVIVALIIAKFRGYSQVVLWGRALNKETIDRSTTLIILSMLFVFISTFLILAFHDFDMHNSFLSAMFEVISAFGTVGLSMGITENLTSEGKLLICIVMFIGRLGPLTMLMALNSRKKKVNIKFPEEQIMIG
ncbi:MAG: hypothetical protein JW864_13550 [Spirochaetes bacterium]|nr:hypothetical protein [Spirochaetota bacterium]